MRIKLFRSLSLLAIGLIVLPPISSAATGVTPEALARMAMSEDPAEASAALAELRSLGPKGLDLMFDSYAERINHYLAQPAASRASNGEWTHLMAALDAVSRQRDSYASHLYWYTDFEQAKAAAKASGKPILSLRLLGNLDEEFSCANSRFFRTVLYANQQVSAVLRARFILHWKSVRPAPRVTIDFGDGRKIESTVTGNSIHYILDAEGRPIDAIPGLYGPKAFVTAMMQAESAFRSSAALTGAAREASLRRYHEARMKAIADQLETDQSRAAVRLDQKALVADSDKSASTPTAKLAAPLAITKSVVERKTLRLIGDGPAAPPRPSTEADLPAQPATQTGIAAWEKLAALHSGDATLDAASVALVRSQYTSVDYDNAAISRIIQNLERYIAVDTVRNEYVLHNTLHRWLAGEWMTKDVESLNEQVYASLFLTPRSDPWLGLASPDIYTGIVNNGITK
jgi:hypothetical protein